MDTPLISVIVPVYKVEAYLDRCVQSIVDQTYSNLEIILVDDGSPDNCGAMCDAWAEKDCRIRVIHKENGGLSDARNTGMAVAVGEYIGFVDSDDYIVSQMYQLLYDRINVDGSDISACGVEMVFEDGTPPRRMTPEGNCILDRYAAMRAVVQESWLKQPVWYKLYRADLIRDILFPVGKYHEDIFWTWQVVDRVNQVSVIDTPCYYYVQRSGSIMAETYSLRRLDAVEAKDQRLRFLEMEYPSFVELGRRELLFTCIYHGQLALRDLKGAEQKTAFCRLRQISNNCAVNGHGMALTHKFWMYLARVNLKVCCGIRKQLGIGL